MRFLVASCVLAALVLTAACSRGKPSGEHPSSASPSGATADGIRWHTYLDMARREAARDHRRVMAAFYSRDCPVCKSMDDSVYTNPEVRALLADLVCVRISMDADSAAAESLHVRQHPTTVFLDENGAEIDRIIGYLAPQAFLTRARNILSGRESVDAMLAQESVHRADPSFLLELGQKLYARRDFAGALQRLEAVARVDPRNERAQTDKALFLTGRILNEQGRYPESIVPLERLVKEFPASSLVPDARLYRAVNLLHIRGRNQDGANELMSILKDYPNTPVASWAREELTMLSQRTPGASPSAPPSGQPATAPSSRPGPATSPGAPR